MPNLTLSQANNNAFLAGHSYRPDFNTLEFASDALARGYQYLETSNSFLTGFRAHAYRETATGNIHIAMAGTDSSSYADLLQDAALSITASGGPQNFQAVEPIAKLPLAMVVSDLRKRYCSAVRGLCHSELFPSGTQAPFLQKISLFQTFVSLNRQLQATNRSN